MSSIGFIKDRLHVCICCGRGDVVRVISLRKASDNEQTCSEKSYLDDDGEALELDEAWFAKTSFERPKLPSELRKRRISILLDPDVITHFKSEGRGWQTRINAALRKVAGL